MLSMYSKAILAFLAAFWTAQPIASQNITKVMVENISCDHVVVVATVDPVSSTYTFYWKVSINRGDDIELAEVGLNGNGNVLVRNRSEDYTYNVKNDPSFLISGNNPFTSRITFTFTNKAFENLIFRTISTPLDIPIPNPVNAMACQGNIRCGSNGTIFCSDRQINGTCMASNNTANPSFVPDGCDPGCQDDITCEDGSSSCTRCDNPVPRIISCANGQTVKGYCKCNGITAFVDEDCPPECQICGIIILCIGGLVAVIGLIILLVGKCQENSSIRCYGALAAGVGFFLCGIALIVWRPADGGFIGGGIAFIIVALCSVGYGICACRQ